MDNSKLLGYILITTGLLALLLSLGVGAPWLWMAVVAVGFLFAYSRHRHYGLLVVGGVLVGVAIGLAASRWGGSAFLLSLAAGFLLIDRVEPRANRWPLYAAAILAALGLLAWLWEGNILTSWWFALLLVLAGAALLLSGRSQNWVSVPPPPAASAPPPTPKVSTPQHLAQPTAPHAHHVPPDDQLVAITPAEEGATEPEPPLSDEQQARLERLTAWRKATAARDGVSAFVVLPNATLTQLARDKPSSLDELAKVKGIGPVKLERYGSELLAVLEGTATS